MFYLILLLIIQSQFDMHGPFPHLFLKQLHVKHEEAIWDVTTILQHFIEEDITYNSE